MKTILFATDFSSNANKALGFAIDMAEKHQADLIMTHVFDLNIAWTYPYTHGLYEMKSQAISSWERTLKESFEQFDSNVKARYMAVEHPSIVKGILLVIEKYKPFLVVTGTKGNSPVKELLLGSITKALIKKSPIPVMAVPEYAELVQYNKVLYASDFREVDLEALVDLVELVRPYEAEIKILHMSTDNEYKRIEKMEWFKEMINDKVSYPAISFELVLTHDVITTLNKYMIQNDVDLLVMLEKERVGIIDKLFHEGLVSKMEFRTWVPLLSYNEHYLQVSDQQNVEQSDTVEN